MFKDPLLVDSLILKDKDHQDYVFKQLLMKDEELNLIYRGSVDGFTNSEIHRKCDQ